MDILNKKSVIELCKNQSNLDKLPKDILCKLLMLVSQETINEMERKPIKLSRTKTTEKEVIDFIKKNPNVLGSCTNCHLIGTFDTDEEDVRMDRFFNYCELCRYSYEYVDGNACDDSVDDALLCEDCFYDSENKAIRHEKCVHCQYPACIRHLKTKICPECAINFKACVQCYDYVKCSSCL